VKGVVIGFIRVDYNNMCNNSITLQLPDYLKETRNNPYVSIDECIISTIQQLWDNNIITHGCCCGHNKDNPSIVVESNYNTDDIIKIKRILKQIDNRKWIIYQWRLEVV